jgi:hypothetical protein
MNNIFGLVIITSIIVFFMGVIIFLETRGERDGSEL